MSGPTLQRVGDGLWWFAVLVGVPPLAYELLAPILGLSPLRPASLDSVLYALALSAFALSLYLRHRTSESGDAGSG